MDGAVDGGVGVYVAHLVRDDTSGSSHIVFIVRNDASHSDMLFQTSDETWQAYNDYGGNSLYTCTSNCPPGNAAAYKGAAKVSYNRPFTTADKDGGRSWVFSAEYPMIRFLEANGYDVSYTSGIDVGTSTGGSLLTNHKVFLSVGHDEYWSGAQRANVEAARDAGVNLAFFSGNEVFWKTRTEPSIDGSNTANRTLVCLQGDALRRGGGPAGPADVDRDVAGPAVQPAGRRRPTAERPDRPALRRELRQHRHQGAGCVRQAAVLAQHPGGESGGGADADPGPGQETLGYEWDVEPDNGFRPAGLFDLSSTTYTSAEVFTDYGSTVQTGSTATHRMSLYRAPSGALVFGAGTVQWSWGLDDPTSTPDTNMRQATVNLFADMGVQPYALGYSGLTAGHQVDRHDRADLDDHLPGRRRECR